MSKAMDELLKIKNCINEIEYTFIPLSRSYGILKSLTNLIMNMNSKSDPFYVKKRIINDSTFVKNYILEMVDYYFGYLSKAELTVSPKCLNTLKFINLEEDLLEFLIENKEIILDDIGEVISTINHIIAPINRHYNKDYLMIPSRTYEYDFTSILNLKNKNILSINGTELIDSKFATNNNLYVVDESESYYSYDSIDTIKYKSRAKGSLKGCKITNGAFDFIYGSTYTNFIKNNKGNIIDYDKDFLYNVHKYLYPNGTMLILMRISRLNSTILSFLSKKFNNIEIYKTTNEGNESIIYLYGRKNLFIKTKENEEKDYNLLMNKIRRASFKSISEMSPIETSSCNKEISLFKSEKVDLKDLFEEISRSNLIDSVVNKTKEEYNIDKKPLLPFNMGQIGLVLTSGELNGIIIGDDNIPHVIKGRTIKETKSSSNDEGNNIVSSTDVISNIVQINVFNADGEYISIT